MTDKLRINGFKGSNYVLSTRQVTVYLLWSIGISEGTWLIDYEKWGLNGFKIISQLFYGKSDNHYYNHYKIEKEKKVRKF